MSATRRVTATSSSRSVSDLGLHRCCTTKQQLPGGRTRAPGGASQHPSPESSSAGTQMQLLTDSKWFQGFPMANQRRPSDCRPISEILARVGDKWTILLLTALGDKKMRFNELHKAVDGISQRMLTVTVRALERDGILIRTMHPTIPPRVEYELSERGRSLRCALAPIGIWALENRVGIEASQTAFDATNTKGV
jgi:DNA-binding HxlR family transcriptional regulator